MIELKVCINALKDLESLEEVDEDLHAEIMALLAQMAADEDLIDRLLGTESEEDLINICRWAEQYYGNRRMLFRLKQVTPEGLQAHKIRIIYAYLPPSSGRSCGEYHVLGVLSRDVFNYKEDNDYTQRIIKDYADLVW